MYPADFCVALTERGISTPPPHPNGEKILRWGRKNEYYAISLGDGYCAGDWTSGEQFTWFPENETLTAPEKIKRKAVVAEAVREAEKQKTERETQAARKAENLWKKFSEQGESPYLLRKNVQGYAVRFYNGGLVIPIRETNGRLTSLQFIQTDGTKKFLSGGKKKGCFHTIGSPVNGSWIGVAEGYATAASVHAAIAMPVMVAFDAVNIVPVIKNLKEKYPDSRIVIFGDDDCWKSENKGRHEAEKAANTFGCIAVFPFFKEETINLLQAEGKSLPTDFNDLHCLEGIETVCSQLRKIMTSENNQSLPSPISEGQPPRSLPIQTFAALLEKEIPERHRILPWLTEGGQAMLFAPAGCGKSYFAQSLAIALLNGTLFLAWQVTKPVSVLYVDGEMAQNDFRDRWISLSQNLQHKSELYTLSHEDFYAQEEKDLNLADQIQQERLKATIESNPSIRVLILDNLSCLFPTLREDKRDDWVTAVLPLLIWMRRRGVAVVLLHHTTKGGDQRGTVARLDTLNTAIKLKPLESEGQKEGAAFEMHFTKSRDCRGKEISPLSCRLIENERGFLEWQCQPLEESAAERLLTIIEDAGGEMTVTEAAAEMGVDTSRISHLKSALIKEERLQKSRKLILVKS